MGLEAIAAAHISINDHVKATHILMSVAEATLDHAPTRAADATIDHDPTRAADATIDQAQVSIAEAKADHAVMCVVEAQADHALMRVVEAQAAHYQMRRPFVTHLILTLPLALSIPRIKVYVPNLWKEQKTQMNPKAMNIRALVENTASLTKDIDKIKLRYSTKPTEGNAKMEDQIQKLSLTPTTNDAKTKNEHDLVEDPIEIQHKFKKSAFPFIHDMVACPDAALSMTLHKHSFFFQHMFLTGFALDALYKETNYFVNQDPSNRWVFAPKNIDPNRTGYLFGSFGKRMVVPTQEHTPWILHAQNMLLKCMQETCVKIVTKTTPWILLSYTQHEFERSNVNYRTNEYWVVSLCLGGIGTYFVTFKNKHQTYPFAKGTIFMHKNDRPHCWKSTDGNKMLVLSMRWGLDNCFERYLLHKPQ